MVGLASFTYASATGVKVDAVPDGVGVIVCEDVAVGVLVGVRVGVNVAVGPVLANPIDTVVVSVGCCTLR